MDKKAPLFLIIFFTALLCQLSAQDNVITAGGNAGGAGGSVSYSVGQTAYTTDFGKGMSVAKGLQQPYEISVVTSSGNMAGVLLEWIAYPNPVTEYLNLRITEPLVRQYEAILYDQSGRVILTNTVSSGESKIFIKELVTGTYFLKVTHIAEPGTSAKSAGSSPLATDTKTFKIIKF